MIGQRSTYRLAPFAGWLIKSALCCRRCAFRFALFQIVEHQLELRDLSIEFLRPAPELHPPQLGELGLVLFDPQPSAGQLGLSSDVRNWTLYDIKNWTPL